MGVNAVGGPAATANSVGVHGVLLVLDRGQAAACHRGGAEVVVDLVLLQLPVHHPHGECGFYFH